MRRAVLPLLAVLALTGPGVAVAAHRTGFAFGRQGGNIRPYQVTIANTGVVRVSGPAVVGRKLLSQAQLGRLNFVAVENQFARLPAATSCRGVLPDVAATFIRVGDRTVRVRGTCVPGYARLFSALARTVKLSLQ